MGDGLRIRPLNVVRLVDVREAVLAKTVSSLGLLVVRANRRGGGIRMTVVPDKSGFADVSFHHCLDPSCALEGRIDGSLVRFREQWWGGWDDLSRMIAYVGRTLSVMMTDREAMIADHEVRQERHAPGSSLLDVPGAAAQRRRLST